MSTVAIKERPILFSAPMVLAILANLKTQTRRIIKDVQPKQGSQPYDTWKGWSLDSGDRPGVFCPYGAPGDRLWVRETCCAEELPSGLDGVRYAADNAFIEIQNTQAASDRWCELYAYGKSRGKQVPSIHMPRWASRITLEITDVRVERLQDISYEDCIAEGWEPACGIGADYWYQELWEEINGAGSWAENPWCWVVKFKLVSRY